MNKLKKIEEKLQAFRDEWLKAKISRRKTIMLQVRALNLAKKRLEGGE